MMLFSVDRIRSVLTICAATTTIAACSIIIPDGPIGRSYEEFIEDRYHKSFLAGDMQAMARSLRRITQFANSIDQTDEQRQKSILRELDVLQGIATTVDEEGTVFNYTLRNPYMGSFLHDISMAEEFAAYEPPDYTASTGLIRSCLYCHQSL